MSSFDKILANSTNRFTAVKNIILSQETLSLRPDEFSKQHNKYIETKNSLILKSPVH